jgi:hypothetical protein
MNLTGLTTKEQDLRTVGWVLLYLCWGPNACRRTVIDLPGNGRNGTGDLGVVEGLTGTEVPNIDCAVFVTRNEQVIIGWMEVAA